jgi:hypothetical protein
MSIAGSVLSMHRVRVRRVISHYYRARQSLCTPASARSRLGLDWANFFIADVQTGFGTFVAFYLARLGWSQSDVGFALGVNGEFSSEPQRCELLLGNSVLQSSWTSYRSVMGPRPGYTIWYAIWPEGRAI